MTDVTVIGAMVNKNLLSRIKLCGSTFSYQIRKLHDLYFKENGFAAGTFNYDNDSFMFVCGYPKFVMLLNVHNCKLLCFWLGNISHPNLVYFQCDLGVETGREFPVRVYV